MATATGPRKAKTDLNANAPSRAEHLNFAALPASKHGMTIAIRQLLLLAPLAMAACVPGSVARKSQPWLDASEARAITTATRQTEPQIRGIWQSRGYGRILDIGTHGVTQYEIGATCYETPRSAESFSEMDSISYRYYRLLPGGRSAIFQLLRGDTNVVFDRLDALPEDCRRPPVVTPGAVADAFLDAFERHYAFFDRRPPDHAPRAARVRSRIAPDMSEAQLWDALASYMDGLSDSHTKLIGEVAAPGRDSSERRRVQDGQGATLPRMRATQGGESAWLVALIEQTLARLGDSAHQAGRERIVWGMLDGRTGYVQIFQMGGFTDREDFGSDAWAEAELAEFDRIMDEAFAAFGAAGAKAVILDLSNNRGGWDRIAKAVAGRFTDRPYTGYTTVARGSGLAPFEHVIEPADGPRFAGPVYLLTSDVTVSGGELATLALRQNLRVTQLGGTTRGAFSTPLAKRLPNGWLLELSNEVFAAPDGNVYEETGLTPQVPFDVYPANAPVTGHLAAIERVLAMSEAE